MDDIKSYIGSGILELYVLGALGLEKRTEVESMARRHPEVLDEIFKIEKALESFSEAQGISPAPRLRSKILNTLKIKDEYRKTPTMARSDDFSFYRYAFAASLALLLMSWAALFIIYNRLENSRRDIAVLQSSNQRFANQASHITNQLNATKIANEVLNDPDYALVRLLGTERSPSSRLAVAFNTQKKEVLLDLTGLKMPANDPEHQYQLWAIVNGQPVDLGIFDVKKENAGLKKMKNVRNPQAFAVTLEKRGGSIKPTMENLMAIGNI